MHRYTMKKQKYSVLLFFILILCGSCGKPKMDIDYTPVSVAGQSAHSTLLKVFLENSGSMDGYMCDGSELKDAVKGFVSSTSSDFDSLSLNFINTSIIPRGNDYRHFIEGLNPVTFKTAGGNRGNTDIGELIDRIIAQTDGNTVSMFISDCILDVPEGLATDFFTDRQIDVTNAIKRFKNKADNAVIVMQLESRFIGRYYGLDGVTSLNGEKRPYYIWLFGPSALLAKVIKDSPIEEIKHGVKNWVAFCKKQTIPFEITNQYGNAPKQMSPTRNGVYEVLVKANLNGLLQSEQSLTDVSHYKVRNASQVKVCAIKKIAVGESPYTHIITLNISKSIKPCAEVLSYGNANQVPRWVNDSNEDTGKDIKKNMDKTTGIKYLIEGVVEAYKQETVLGDIQFVINNK